MSRWRAFKDVLDEILTDAPPAIGTSVHAEARQSARIASTPIYAYAVPQTLNRFWAAPGPSRHAAVAEFARHSVRTEAPSPHRHTVQNGANEATGAQSRSEARVRRLRPVEEGALQTFLRLGAALDGNFTSRELRSTFRALAQRYHPDRHPHVSDAERMQLGSTFAELTSAYDVLHNAAH